MSLEKYDYVFQFLGSLGDELRFMFEPNGDDSIMSWELIFNPTSQPASGRLRQEYYAPGGMTRRFRYVMYNDKIELWLNNPKGRKDPYIGVFDGSERELPIPKGVFKEILRVRDEYQAAKESDEKPREPDLLTQMAEMLGLVDSDSQVDEKPITDELKDLYRGLDITILGAERMRKTYQRWAKELGCRIEHPDMKVASSNRMESYIRKSDVVIAVVPFIKHIGTALAKLKCETARKLYIPIAGNSGAQNLFIEAAEQIKRWKAARNVMA